MTAVLPMNPSVQKRPNSKRTSVEKADGKKNSTEDVVGDASANQEDAGSLFESLSPLLISMRLSGMYFKWPFGKRISRSRKAKGQRGSSSEDYVESHRSTKEVICAIYSIIVTALLWFHVVRMITVFTPTATSLYEIFSRLSVFLWPAMCAIQQTAFFIASHSGKLDQVLAGLRFKSHEEYSRIHRYAVYLTIVQWSIFILNMIFFYLNFVITENSIVSFILAPIGIYIQVTDMTIYRMIGLVFCVHQSIAIFLPIIVSMMLSVVFCIQFHHVDKQLREAIKNPSGIKDDDIEDIREQHQKLCRLVERSDHFLRIHNFSGVIGMVMCLIALLYTLIKYSTLVISGPVSMIFFCCYVVFNTICLLMTAIGGTFVNHYAHKTRDHIHNIHLSLLRPETICKVTVFLFRTSSEPIGFTVMGLFVIDKNTLIAVLSQIVTYFLLLIQFPVSDDTGSSIIPLQNITNGTHSK